MPKIDKKKQWIKIVSEFDQSSEDRKIFCEKRNLDYKKFGYWYVRYSNNSKSHHKIVSEDLKPKKSSNVENYSLTSAQSKNDMEWLELKIETPIEKDNPKKTSITVKIGKAEVLVEEGFDKFLFFDVSKILGELC